MRWVMRSFLAKPPVSMRRPEGWRYRSASPRSIRARFLLAVRAGLLQDGDPLLQRLPGFGCQVGQGRCFVGKSGPRAVQRFFGRGHVHDYIRGVRLEIEWLDAIYDEGFDGGGSRERRSPQWPSGGHEPVDPARPPSLGGLRHRRGWKDARRPILAVERGAPSSS